MIRGTCKLCLATRSLCKSHLLPQAIYPLLTSADKDPIVVTSEVAMHTSRQVSDHLLCEDCEEILNKGGETWMLSRIATIDNAFPLYDTLWKVAPDIDEPDVKAFAAAKNRDIDVTKIIHFASGIFWKASVHSWRGGVTKPMIELGPYSEKLRTFVLGTTPFPEHATLNALVLPAPVKMISAQFPCLGGREPGYRSYCFYVPGIDFRLCVGKEIPLELRSVCLSRHPLKPILVRDINADIAEGFVMAFRTARKSARLQEFLNSPRPRS